MTGLPAHKIDIVRKLVEAAPDRVVGRLQAALAGSGGDAALAGVRKLVEAEANDRRLRNTVLAPIAPLCVGDGRDPQRLVFPLRVLALMWRGLKAEAPLQIAAAQSLLEDLYPQESPPVAFDDLVMRAALSLRAGEQRDFREAAELADAARPDGAAVLARCLDLGPIVRQTTTKLPDWITRITEERAAAARVAYNDAVAVAEDAGPRFFEMLAAQLAQPWQVLRIVSAVMDRPNERYMAASEFAVFALRLMDEIDLNLAAVAHFDPDGGPPAGRAAGKTVELLTLQISEIEDSLEMGREGGWGGRLANHKKSLASTVEWRLREAEKAVALALPTQATRVARVMKAVPRLAPGPDAALVGRALALLHFTEEIRSSANYGGFASTRAKVLEHLGESLDHYVEDVLDTLRHNEAPEPAVAKQFLGVVADFNALIRDARAADTIRRRAAAA
jgi:hypothetical protein